MPGLAALFGTGLGLAAAAGLNSYAVLLVWGWLVRFSPEDFPGPMARAVSAPGTLLALAGLFALEFVVDKIPGLDHLWDLLHALLRPLAGAYLAMATLEPYTTAPFVALAAGLGAVAALVAHVVKTTTRATTTALTRGIANIFLSLVEDWLAVLMTFVAVFLPIVSLGTVSGMGLVFLISVPRLARSLNVLDRSWRIRRRMGDGGRQEPPGGGSTPGQPGG